MEHVMKLKENLIEWKILKHDDDDNNNNNNNNNNSSSIQGQGYKSPNFGRVCGYLLSKLLEDVKKMIERYCKIWKQNGCTIMTDGWTNRCRRTLINFLVYCPKGTIFLKSVDASHASKIADLFFKLFKDVVLFVSPENVVHTMTDNDTNYIATGRLLEAKFPKLYWFSCVAHCINLMLQDIGKLDEASEMVSHASKITKYIYNHCHPLYLMRKFTSGREKLRPAPTHFATNFIALQSILAQKDALRDMLTEILVRVLRIVNSEDTAAMDFLYQAFYKAREEMVKRFQRRKKIVEPYLKILDTHWDSQLQKNLHAIGYWLNSAFRFNADEFEKYKQTTSGLLDVIEKYAYGELELNSKLTSELRIYKNAEDDFRRQSALRERSTVMPNQLNLENDQDNDGPNNNAMEDIDANQNEKNVDQAPNLSYEDIDTDFELIVWT
ncbi:uncharacterized protein LOC130949409 [Arachis stenosperma]|uniref:uncharacterized protein LOC130949409 n=1 Tax=Arachis stenosperma TaxID=217475 RepID=UPI0025AD0B48|nr:uncharacterized protein LOC130949409 [Arachis stenosperma]